MSGIVALAKQWLLGDNSLSDRAALLTHRQIIESLLAEIQRIETLHSLARDEIKHLKSDRVNEIRRTVAEECAVICETAEYAVRSYGCAQEIRKKFGLRNWSQ